MKKFGISLLAFLLLVAVSDNVMAEGQQRLRDGSCQDTPVTSAPLDGGILSILGAAGIAYYVSRKKKVLKE